MGARESSVAKAVVNTAVYSAAAYGVYQYTKDKTAEQLLEPAKRAKNAVMRFFYGEPQPEAQEEHRTPAEEHRTPIETQLASGCSSDSESDSREISERNSTPEIDDVTLVADSPDTEEPESGEKKKLSRQEKNLLKHKRK